MQGKTKRPTPCDQKTYLDFVSKVRRIGREIGEVETDLFKLYIEKGEKLFSS